VFSPLVSCCQLNHSAVLRPLSPSLMQSPDHHNMSKASESHLQRMLQAHSSPLTVETLVLCP